LQKRIVQGILLAMLVSVSLILASGIRTAKACTIVGDVNNDGVVDIFDIRAAALAFGFSLGDPEWNPNADWNADNKVDIFDFFIIASHFGHLEIRVTLAEFKIHPRTLNLKSKGRWITACIKLPEGYDAADIDVESIRLNGIIPAESKLGRKHCGSDSNSRLIVKFDRAKIISYVLDSAKTKKSTTITLTIIGKLNNGTPFIGSTTIKILFAKCTR
jgi:hypothetical protein